MIKLKTESILKKKKSKPSNSDEPSKPRLWSQTYNLLSLRSWLNQEPQFPTNLIFISQRKFNNEQQIKKPKKT